jgi:hypothetical protein
MIRFTKEKRRSEISERDLHKPFGEYKTVNHLKMTNAKSKT